MKMSDIRIVNGLCRCCHTEGNFKSLGVAYCTDGIEEIYSVMIRETFQLNISPLPGDVGGNTYSICSVCEPRLRDAACFKKQVLVFEEKFLRFYTECGVKATGESYDKNVKLEDNGFGEDPTEAASILLADKNDLNDNKGEELPSKEILIKPDVDDLPLSVLNRNRCESVDSDKREADDHHSDDGETDFEDLKESHKQLKDKPKNFSCKICQKKFRYKGRLEIHMKLHTSEITHVCRLCDIKLINNEELTKHIEENHCIDGQYICTICKKNFKKAHFLKCHWKSHFRDKFKCSYCPKEFERRNALKEHLNIHTKERNYSCEVCQKIFGHKQRLKYHMLTHTGERPYICDVCGKRFTQRGHLQRHIIIIHSEVKPFSCKVCNKQFWNKTYLLTHERTHTGERPFCCDVCKKDFTAYTTLKVHMRMHTGVKPYTCTVCNRQFSQKTSFKLHERTHTGEKPFACKVCYKRFTTNGNLKNHTRVHTGEKPCPCEICKRCFRDTGQLKQHMRVHTAVKLFTCKICNKQIRSLTKHMVIHSEERRYKCDVCNKQFSVNGNLKAHMRIHTGEKPYSCDVCNSQFAQSSALKRHRCSRGNDG